MSMTKKDFIRLADYVSMSREPFSQDQISILADFCEGTNSMFKRQRWLDYIAGMCGPSGGKLKEGR